MYGPLQVSGAFIVCGMSTSIERMQTHNLVLQFSSLFVPTDVSKYEIRNQKAHEDYITLHKFIELVDF